MPQYDNLLRSVGEFGLYQKIACFLLFLSSIPNGILAMIFVFTHIIPDHHCKVQEATTQLMVRLEYITSFSTFSNIVCLQQYTIFNTMVMLTFFSFIQGANGNISLYTSIGKRYIPLAKGGTTLEKCKMLVNILVNKTSIKHCITSVLPTLTIADNSLQLWVGSV